MFAIFKFQSAAMLSCYAKLDALFTKKCRTSQERRQKNLQGVGTNGKVDRKIAKKTEKYQKRPQNSTIKPLPGVGGQRKKDQKKTEK